jgi:hypothetical protein
VRRKKDAIPTLFNWSNNVIKRKSPRKRLSYTQNVPIDIPVDGANRAEASDTFDSAAITNINSILPEHDYVCTIPTTEEKLEAAMEEIDRLRSIINSYNNERFCIERFSKNPEFLKFYTGISSYDMLMKVYAVIAPSALTMIAWSQLPRNIARGDIECRDTCNNTALHLVDQFFLVLVRLRTGMLELELADRFNISQSTVSRLLITWLNYLYFF